MPINTLPLTGQVPAALDKNSSTHGYRILFLVPFVPRRNAAHGGSRVIAQIITRLAQRHRVGVCYLRGATEPPMESNLQEQCDIVEEVLIPEIGNSILHQWANKVQVWAKVLAGKPLWAIDRSVAAYGECIHRLVHDWSPDIIQIEFHVMGQYLPAIEDYSAPRILVQHEPGKEAAREISQYHHRQGLVMPYLNLLAWQRFEQSIMRQVQAVVVFTERDRKTLAQFGQPVPIVRIPLGSELPEFPLNPLGSQPLSLLFVGSFHHLPNIDGAVRLIHNIFPRVQASFPEALLYIVGSHPPHEITEPFNSKVIVTGHVPEITPYLDQAALVVAPLRMGGGMRVKVLEALANGKAVVASPLATEGLDLVNGEQLVIARSDQEFSNAIIKLFGAPEQRSALAQRARDWACANLRWDGSLEAYEHLYQMLITGQWDGIYGNGDSSRERHAG